MSEWLMVVLILGGGALFYVTAQEISVRIGARYARHEPADYRRHVRRRLRRAFWHGSTLIAGPRRHG